MSFKIDLHTHSFASPDGGLSVDEYRQALDSGALDYIAITDHNSVAAALEIREQLGEFGSRIIIGEEIMTTEGEVVGLYLKARIPGGLSLKEAVKKIRQQGGLVYIPHPFEGVRSGVSDQALASIQSSVDIIETYNGRAIFQNRRNQVRNAMRKANAAGANMSGAASSDAHGPHGWHKTYSIIAEAPTRDNLASLLHDATYSRRTVGFGIFYPKINRLRNRNKGNQS